MTSTDNITARAGGADTHADLVTTVTTDKPRPNTGDTVITTVTVTNKGPATATSAGVSFIAPPGITSVRYSRDNGVTWTEWTGSVPLPDIPNGQSAQVLIRGIVTRAESGTIDSRYTAASTNHDPDTANNTATATISFMPVSDLKITATPSNYTPSPGDTVLYTVTVTNNGPATAPTPTVDFAATPLLGNIEYSADNGASWNPWAGGARLGDIPSGGSARLLIRGVVPVNVTGSITCTLSTKCANAEQNMFDNSTAVSVTSSAAADLMTTVTALRPSHTPGDTVSYTVTVHNNGPSTATGAGVSFITPRGLSKVEFSKDNGATWSEWRGSTPLPDIPNGGDARIMIRGVVSGDNVQTIEMALAASSPQKDPNSDNNTARAVTAVTAGPSGPAAPPGSTGSPGLTGPIITPTRPQLPFRPVCPIKPCCR